MFRHDPFTFYAFSKLLFSGIPDSFGQQELHASHEGPEEQRAETKVIVVAPFQNLVPD
jgi:hypothetical protein